jgi:hypothetical protein
LALALTLAVPVRGLAHDADPAVPELAIRIYDYAGVGGSTLARTFEEIERIYRMAGVSVLLMQCRTDMAAPVLDSRCAGRAGPTTIIVRVLPREMASLAGTNKRVFGFAMTASRPGFGVIANAFHHQVEKLAKEWGYHRGAVLGHVIAHEVGHLLLGFVGHSRGGIMQMPGNGPHLSAAHKGRLVFTRSQSERIRADVFERIRAEFGTESPGELRVEVATDQSRAGGL